MPYSFFILSMVTSPRNYVFRRPRFSCRCNSRSVHLPFQPLESSIRFMLNVSAFNPEKYLFFQIKSINTFFEWLNQSAILQLFPEIDEQGEQLHWRERQFMYGGASLRLGPPRLRQLRVKTGTHFYTITKRSTEFC